MARLKSVAGELIVRFNKMTRREAIHILIEHAANDCIGSGCGPGHRIPSEEECERVAMAILKVWPEKNYNPNWFNLHLPDPTKSNKQLNSDQ